MQESTNHHGREELRTMLRDEANRRYGPDGWRSASAVFTAANGDTESVRVVNAAALGDSAPDA